MEDSEEALVLRQIAPEDVSTVWPEVAPGVEQVLRKCPDDFTVEDVYWFLKANRATLFIIEGGGFFVVEVTVEPFRGRRTLNIWLMYFLGARKVKAQLLEQMKQLGRNAQCVRVHFKSPRRGWEKEAEGFKVKLITYEALT